jgi:hypothetical protein
MRKVQGRKKERSLIQFIACNNKAIVVPTSRDGTHACNNKGSGAGAQQCGAEGSRRATIREGGPVRNITRFRDLERGIRV